MNLATPTQSSAAALGRVRCLGTALAVPECSCTDCLNTLMQAHAPEVVHGEAQPVS